jgi:hypothetical protein
MEETKVTDEVMQMMINMTKLLEAQQKRESVAVDMIAAGIAAEREACAKMCEEFDLLHVAEAIRYRSKQ